MTIAEMHRDVKVGVDKVDSLGYPNLLPEEIDVFLNTEIERFITLRLYGSKYKDDSFEETQKRTDDLRNLVVNTNIVTFTTGTNNKENGYFVITPSDYWHALQEECSATIKDCKDNAVAKRVPVIAITHEKFNKIIEDPFNKPGSDRVLRLSYGLSGSSQQFELITDGSLVMGTYHLRYIKKPASVRYGTTYSTPTTDVNCDLPEHTHREIIKMAVASILGNVESQRTGLAREEVKELE